MIRTLFLFSALNFGFLQNASADTAYLDESKITQNIYFCTNGGTVYLQTVRYNNLKKVTFVKEGSLDQVGYALFNIMTDYYGGTVYTSAKFLESKTQEPIFGDVFGYINIKGDSSGLELTVTPMRAQHAGLAITCKSQ